MLAACATPKLHAPAPLPGRSLCSPMPRRVLACPPKRRLESFQPKAAPQAAAAAEVLYEATGVPLVDELMKMATLDVAVRHSVQLVACAAVGVAVGALVLAVVERVAGQRSGGEADNKSFNLVAAAAASAFKPSKVLLPFYGLAYAATVVSALAQVAARKMKADFAALCFGFDAEVLSVLKIFTQLVQDTSELVLIIGAAWACIDLKNRVLSWVMGNLLSDGDAANDGVVHLLRPLSGLLTFLILLAAAMTALSAYGVNVGPLMASVGGIGVVLGLASQSLMANVASAITLFASRPFVVGDRIQLLAAGALVVEGAVIQIEPMRTIIRDDSGNPVYINNAEVTGYMVKNLTQNNGGGAL